MASIITRRCLVSTCSIGSVVRPSPTTHVRPRCFTGVAAAPSSPNRCEPASVEVSRLHVQLKRRRFSSKYSRGSRISNSYHDDDDRDDNGGKGNKTVLVLGSSGALGRELVSHFSRLNHVVIGADAAEEPPEESLDELNAYVALPSVKSPSSSLGDLSASLFRGVDRLQKEEKLFSTSGIDAIVCAAGAWEGDVVEGASRAGGVEGSPMDEELARAAADNMERMMRANFYPVVAASHVAHRFIANGGLFVVIGASAALSPTPGMIGYGSAKASLHHYIQTIGAMTSTKQKIGTTKQHPGEMTAVGILPLTLDTPANREGNPEEKSLHTWVKPSDIALEIGDWIEKPVLRPHSGSLVKVISNRRADGSGGAAAFHLVR